MLQANTITICSHVSPGWNTIQKGLGSLCGQRSLLNMHDSLHVHAFVPGKVAGAAQRSCPLQRPPFHSVTGHEVAAVDKAGHGLQQPHRSIAQLVEQPDKGRHVLHASMYVCFLAMVTTLSMLFTARSTCLEV